MAAVKAEAASWKETGKSWLLPCRPLVDRWSSIRSLPTLPIEMASNLFARQQMEGEIMRSIFAALFSVALLLATAFLQPTPAAAPNTPTSRSDQQPNQPTEEGQTSGQPGANPTQATNALKIASGSVIPVQVSKTIDAKKAKAGDVPGT
jgi:hypothetical protein